MQRKGLRVKKWGRIFKILALLKKLGRGTAKETALPNESRRETQKPEKERNLQKTPFDLQKGSQEKGINSQLIGSDRCKKGKEKKDLLKV